MEKFEDKPLSFRMQWHIDYLQGPNTAIIRDTMRKALQVIKRYEDAPVVELTECNQIEGATDFDWGDMQAAIGPMKPGQRVRIVLDKEG